MLWDSLERLSEDFKEASFLRTSKAPMLYDNKKYGIAWHA